MVGVLLTLMFASRHPEGCPTNAETESRAREFDSIAVSRLLSTRKLEPLAMCLYIAYTWLTLGVQATACPRLPDSSAFIRKLSCKGG